MSRIRDSVAWRLSLWFLLLSLLPIGTMLVFVRNNVAGAFTEQAAVDTQRQAEIIARAAALAPTDSALRDVLSAGGDAGRSVFVVRPDGSTRAAIGSDAGVSLARLLPPNVVEAAIGRSAGHHTGLESGRVVGYAPLGGSSGGAVVVVKDGGAIDRSIRTMEETSLAQLAASLAIMALVGGIAIWALIGPIQRLTAAADRVGSGNLDVKLDPSRMDGELANLAIAFNGMTDRLRESHDLLEQRVADRTRDLAALNAIAAVVSRSLSIDGVLNATVAKAIEVLEMDVGAAYRVDENPLRMSLLAFQGLNKATAEDLVRVPIEEGATLSAARSGGIAVRTIDQYPPGQMRDLLVGEGMQMVVGFPLVAKGRTIGACALGSRRPRTLSADDIRLLEAVGQQVGVALENARLYEAAEDAAVAAERNRLARDLHDAVTQTLFSASLIAEVLPKLWDRNPEDGRRRLEELRQLTRGALAEMRSLLLELRPSVLIETPLSNLLRQLAEATTGRARLPVRVSVELSEIGVSGGSSGNGRTERQLPNDAQVAIYRIVQESLNNVVKHADASEASISLRQANLATEVVVRDDGRGFDPAAIPADHLGVAIMRERARSVGAEYRIESRPGDGTTVTVRLAVPDEPREDQAPNGSP